MTVVRSSRLPVDVLGAVSVRTPAGCVDVTGLGETVHVTVPRARMLFKAVVRALELPKAERRRHFTLLGHGLTAGGIELSFRIDRREIARMGSGTRSGIVARSLSMPGVKLRPSSLLAATVLHP